MVSFLWVNIVISLGLGIVLYLVSDAIYFKSFVAHKASLAKSIALSIDGSKFTGYRDETALNDPEFLRYYYYMKKVAKSEEHVTWIYSLFLDSKTNLLYYAIDATPLDFDVIWLENDDMGLQFFVDDRDRLTIMWDGQRHYDSVDIKSNLLVTIDQEKRSLFLGDQEILHVTQMRPLKVKSPNFTIDGPDDYFTDSIIYEDRKYGISYSLSEKDKFASIPGWPHEEDPTYQERIRNVIRTCKADIPSEPSANAYGRFLSVLAPIHRTPTECVGAIVLDVSPQDVFAFRKTLAMAAAGTSILSFLISIIVSLLLALHLSRPVQLLTDAVEDVSHGNFQTAVAYRSEDELGQLASRFNEMVFNLKLAREERDALVSLQEELRMARKILESILPKSMPSLSSIEIAVEYLPTTLVGGDFYDFHQISETKLGVFVADVSGHGMPAAIIASMLKISFQITKELGEKPAALLQKINQTMMGNCGLDFITACYALLDIEKREITVGRAGHPPILLIRNSNGLVEEINPKGKLLGSFANQTYEEMKVPLEFGDKVILYTDGVIEARNLEGQLMGEHGLKAILTNQIHHDSSGLSGLVMQKLVDFVGKGTRSFEDDVTVLTMQLKN